MISVYKLRKLFGDFVSKLGSRSLGKGNRVQGAFPSSVRETAASPVIMDFSDLRKFRESFSKSNVGKLSLLALLYSMFSAAFAVNKMMGGYVYYHWGGTLLFTATMASSFQYTSLFTLNIYFTVLSTSMYKQGKEEKKTKAVGFARLNFGCLLVMGVLLVLTTMIDPDPTFKVSVFYTVVGFWIIIYVGFIITIRLNIHHLIKRLEKSIGGHANEGEPPAVTNTVSAFMKGTAATDDSSIAQPHREMQKSTISPTGKSSPSGDTSPPTGKPSVKAVTEKADVDNSNPRRITDIAAKKVSIAQLRNVRLVFVSSASLILSLQLLMLLLHRFTPYWLGTMLLVNNTFPIVGQLLLKS
jgi:hypothetical protein